MSLLHICAFCILAGAAPQMLSQTQSVSGTTTAATGSPQSTKVTAHAAQLINAGDLKGALTELDALAIKDPTLPGLQYLRGFAYYQQSELSNAETAFRKAL